MSDMKWRTAIADVRTDDVLIRGHALSDLIGRVTYSDMTFLLLRGDLPSDSERRVLEAVLVSLADHGISPSTIVARTLTSCGTPIQAALAGGVLTIADWHGGSGQEVAEMLTPLVVDGVAAGPEKTAELIANRRAAGMHVPGFGHPQHTDGDPRARQLMRIAAEQGTAGPYQEVLVRLGASLADTSGKEALRSPNITGALAAILLDLGFDWQSVRGIVIAARSLGLTAHILEELAQGNKWRHASHVDVEYTGPAHA